jgi:O-antigen ligase
MRRLAWGLLLAFAFTVPWEHSLEFPEPFGSPARLAGLLLLLAAIPALLQTGFLRQPGPLQALTLAFFLWFLLSMLWTVDAATTAEKLRAYFQEMMIVWLLWEFAASEADLRAIVRAIVAGCAVLALLTFSDFRSAEALAAEQVRFTAYGQDPNDVARFLDLGLPLAAWLARTEQRRSARWLALLYLPLGVGATLLTASRGGFLALLIALVGCAALFLRRRGRMTRAAIVSAPVFLAALWIFIPAETFSRINTIPEQLSGGDFNQRTTIWQSGWQAFLHAPWFGSGGGTFVEAAGLLPTDTAHNTPLTLLVTGGLCALFLAAAIVIVAVLAAWRSRGPFRIALLTSLSVWAVSAMAATVEESRFTWLLLALAALAARVREESLSLSAIYSGSSAVVVR